jgi:hypothetical protein
MKMKLVATNLVLKLSDKDSKANKGLGLKKWSLDIAIVKATWKYFRFFEVEIIGIKNYIHLCNFGVWQMVT